MTVISGIAHAALRLSTDLQKGIIGRFLTAVLLWRIHQRDDLGIGGIDAVLPLCHPSLDAGVDHRAVAA
jgi:hypothetical protein